MRTTLDINEQLLREARERAASEGETLTRLIEKALRDYLRSSPANLLAFRLELLTKQGRLLPGLNIEDRNLLCERMESRA